MKARLDRGNTVILDGGTGTELEKRGVPMSESAWCGLACLTHAEIVEAVHLDYIASGARIITTNTFASSRLMLERTSMADKVDEITAAALSCAKRARDQSGLDDVVIAGSLSHMVPLIPGSNSIVDGTPDDDLQLDAFTELAMALKRHGADLILLEMMNHPQRARLAMQAAATTGLPVWCGFSARRGSEAELLSFSRQAEIPFTELVDLLDQFEIEAAGPMHSSVDITGDALALIAEHFDGPLLAYPDSGYFAMPNWQFVDIVSPDDLVGFARGWYRLGARVVGGCCGLGVEHIRALAEADLIH